MTIQNQSPIVSKTRLLLLVEWVKNYNAKKVILEIIWDKIPEVNQRQIIKQLAKITLKKIRNINIKKEN